MLKCLHYLTKNEFDESLMLICCAFCKIVELLGNLADLLYKGGDNKYLRKKRTRDNKEITESDEENADKEELNDEVVG